MTILDKFNTFIDNLLGLEKEFSGEEKQVIGMEVSNALSAIRILAKDLFENPDHVSNTLASHVAHKGFSYAFDGDVTTFELARHVDPNMPVTEFITAVSDAFHLWPYLLTRKNRPTRKIFSYCIRDALFRNNDTGWNAYASEMRKRGLDWFGHEEST